MKLLADNELIYGRLLPISEPHLVGRYNKALKAFGLPQTALEHFRIDMTGFSPEIAEELDDRDYLDPNGVNRRFVILTPEQEHLPVVHTQFSNTAGLMHQFFDGNRRVVHAITIKDALFGEIEDPIAIVTGVEDLLAIEEVRFRVLSAEDMLGKASELRGLVDRLKSSRDGWRDDDMLNRMVALARETGDIRQNALVPDKLVFEHTSYWANHFGGVFIFRDDRTTTVICNNQAPGFRRSRPWEVSYIDIADHARIFEYLSKSGRLQLPRASWVEPSGFFEHRAEMAIFDLIGKVDPDVDLSRADKIWLQTWMHRNAGLIAEQGVYPFLQEMIREISATGQIKMGEVRSDRRLLLCRAAPAHKDQWLINRLLARLAPFDFVSRFVFDKQGFYEAYDGYSEGYRAHVVKVLSDTYLKDKAALRARLYGLEGNQDNA
ncbi:hypothetical protein HPDFL43_14187 [Hoeflea phototrophica DFL-43]|uniref:Uncharacterized protein n=1 Tax=Hoeflea phototrophica (strain DSM 17068 / NCIMB 14078 / DFL-43) TaxID=411684 RepID=A9D284_HOEPD|nr:DUF6638 family protein [Hoeflea phototrophica]EDQ34153.1 hypothetical protein HPDFL43_14187 [Hoeflea phototrophica DFL-43]